MAIRDRRALENAARDALYNTGSNAGKLILVHAGAAALFSVGLAAVDFFLQSQISGTSGLGGLGTRSILQTVQQVLLLLSYCAPVFWNMGYTYAVLKLSRREPVCEKDLLQGFRRFLPVLRLMLLECGLALLICIPVTSIGSTLLSATPLAFPFYKVMMQLLPEDGSPLDYTALDADSVTALMEAMTPILIGCAILCVLALLPALYRLRLSKYYLMDEPQYGALAAMLRSTRHTRRRCLQLLRLDLHFWWYYAAQLLTAAIAYGDRLLPLLGIQLPISADAGFFLFYAAGLACQVALYRFAKNRIELTYVQAYEAMRVEPASAPVPKPASGKHPWNDPPM